MEGGTEKREKSEEGGGWERKGSGERMGKRGMQVLVSVAVYTQSVPKELHTAHAIQDYEGGLLSTWRTRRRFWGRVRLVRVVHIVALVAASVELCGKSRHLGRV